LACAKKVTLLFSGGQDIYGSPYDTIEKYDPELDEWNDLGLLSKPLKFHASVTTKARYVIATGGHKNIEKNFWFKMLFSL
jgi:hypothetical protein